MSPISNILQMLYLHIVTLTAKNIRFCMQCSQKMYFNYFIIFITNISKTNYWLFN